MEKPENGKTQPPVEIDQIRLQQHLQEVRDNQNLALGALGGIGAAALGAWVWAMVAYYTDYQIGWMAIGVGFLVGYSVRQFGKGVDTSFGVIGAVFSLAGCLAGNLLTICVFIAKEEGVEVTAVLSQLDFDTAVEMLVETFNPVDLLFYGFALYYGYKSSFYRISDEKLKELTRLGGR